MVIEATNGPQAPDLPSRSPIPAASPISPEVAGRWTLCQPRPNPAGSVPVIAAGGEIMVGEPLFVRRTSWRRTASSTRWTR